MTDISLQPLEASLLMDMWQHLILWAAAIVVSIVVVNTVVNRFVLSRLLTLSNALKELGLGQRSQPIPGNQDDEIGQVALAFNEMASKIQARDEENQRLSEAIQRQSSERGELLKRLITAQEDERARIARELHDELGQALAVLALQTRLAQNAVESKPEQAVRILDETQDLVGNTTEQMYNLILALRPSVLDDLGLAAALRSQCERLLREGGIQFHLDASRLTNRLPPDLEIVLYRVFQEALTNAFRHSRAHAVTVVLAQENGAFVGEVCDDGQGFDPALMHQTPNEPHGLGLAGMQERLLHHNGQLEVTSAPGQGTRIKIIVPVPEVHHA